MKASDCVIAGVPCRIVLDEIEVIPGHWGWAGEIRDRETDRPLSVQLKQEWRDRGSCAHQPVVVAVGSDAPETVVRQLCSMVAYFI